MAESAALLGDEVLPHESMRQWVLSVPFPLRFLSASQPKVMGKALGIVYRTIARRLPRYLERQGSLERDAGNSYLAVDRSDEDPMDQLRGHSITYRIAVRPVRLIQASIPVQQMLLHCADATKYRLVWRAALAGKRQLARDNSGPRTCLGKIPL